MRGSFRGIRIDRERALKAGAMAGLAVLGISTLPGLLKTPEPPPVPADVGFRPAEMARYAAGPTPEELARRRAEAGKKKRLAERKQRRRERAAARKRRERAAAREKRKAPKNTAGRKEGTGRQREPDPGVTATASAPPPPDSVPAYSPPAYVPPVSVPPPAPEPTPSTPASSPPADGSEEFAPR